MKRALVLAVWSLAGTEAQAQGFALNRYQPAPAGDPFFGVPSAAIETPGLRASVGADYAHAPLVLRTIPDRRPAGTIVTGQLNLHAGLALALARRALLSVDVPVALLNDGDSPAASGGTRISSPGSAALGDLRAGLRARLLGDQAFALAASASLWFPTGSRAQYTGDGRFRPGVALLASGQAARLLWAATAGLDRRAAGDLASVRMAQALTAAAAVGMLFADDSVLVGPELAAATVLGGDQRSTNLEALLGIHLRGDQFAFGVGAGPGLSVGTGTPDVRILATAGYAGSRSAPPPEPAPPPLRAEALAPEPPPRPPAAEPPPEAPSPEAPAHVSVSQTEIVIEERIQFEAGSARLGPSWTAPLERVARVMNEHAEVQRVEIEGHTDARERERSGLELAKQRAEAVRDWLIEHGIDSRRLAARSYGRARPAAQNATSAGRARNRRVEFRIVSLPGGAEPP